MMYRNDLPQLGDEVFLTDSGLETDLIFNVGFDLADFAAFPLLDDEAGRAALSNYARDHAELAAERGVGVVIETPTWRANSDWGQRNGFDGRALDRLNREAVALLSEVRSERKPDSPPMVISGNIGPRDDGHNPASLMTADEAQAYHSPQISTFADTDVDIVTALTLTYVDEAIGIARAAAAAGVPSAISFTVETDGRLPDGTTVAEAIKAVDGATDNAPAYYMINCAHPTHIGSAFADAAGSGRLRGVRVNASKLSHTELDSSDEQDTGNPDELGAEIRQMRSESPQLTIIGGCCGTDVRHIRAIADANV